MSSSLLPAPPALPAADEGLTLDANVARRMILKGTAPPHLRVRGVLDLSQTHSRLRLPEGLVVDALDLSGCTRLDPLPEGLRFHRLKLSGCTALQTLPARLSCFELELDGTGVRTLPADLRVEYRLNLEGCPELEALPEGLKVGTLILRNCTALRTLPEGLDVCFLDISGCTGLERWPARATLRIGRLDAGRCAQFRELPPWVRELAQLDLRDCAGIRSLPEGLRVFSWIDVAGTGITSLPKSLLGVSLRWRGVPIDARIAFHPETITVPEVLAERNAELRRVLLERVGYEAFMSQAKATLLDMDQDPGGQRQLLRVALPGDEPLVCLGVTCPSTGRQYLLRVPPDIRTCRQAAAWIAGFDNEEEYRPVAET